MPANSVDFILTDPSYLVNFRDRQGRTLQNDVQADWLKPAMAEAFRVLKDNRLMLCFYGWPRAEKFLEAWRSAGFRPVGHLVFRKSYTTKATDFLKYQHEQAYLLAKGRPPVAAQPIPDVQRLYFTGNKLHPTQTRDGHANSLPSMVGMPISAPARRTIVYQAFSNSPPHFHSTDLFSLRKDVSVPPRSVACDLCR